MNISIWDYHRISTSHLQSQSEKPLQKIFSLLSLNQLFANEKSPFNISQFQFIRHPISLFLNHSHGSHTKTACWVIPNDSASSSCVWFWFSSSNASNSLSSNFFGCPEVCLQRWNVHPWNVETIPHWFISWSSVTINFDKHSMGFSRTFLPIKAENQNLPRMLLD